MQIKIVVYGGLRYELGQREIALEVPHQDAVSVADVLALLVEKFPTLGGKLDKVAISVGDAIVDRAHPVKDGDEVCLLPPVSGGSGAPTNAESGKKRRHLSAEPLDLNELLAETEDPACGGLVIFSGDIRNHNEGRKAVAITYEAHEVLASKVLQTIEDEVLERFETRQCRIQHRTGRVNVGESSVLVVVRAAHRAAAFEGARYAIDELKERVPIWKEEHYEEGDSRFLDGVPLRGASKE